MTSDARPILVVSQMYPGPGAPDLGIFVRGHVDELRGRGHEVRVVAVTRRGGGVWKHLAFAVRVMWAVLTAPRRSACFAHFLAPAGTVAAVAATLRPDLRLVVIAHGRDVRNIGTRRGVGGATRVAVRRADATVAVSRALARDLVRRIPEAGQRLHVVDMGIDTRHRFVPGDADEARAALGWDGVPPGPAFLAVGTLDERKNVLRLASAFARLGHGSLTYVGDGPLREQLARDHPGVRLVGQVEQDEVVLWMQACDVLCLPSTVEPFGQVLIEAMACGRSVVATRVGGPPEFVPPEAGVLVDPLSVDDIERGLRAAATLPSPNLAARAVAEQHDVGRQVDRLLALVIGSPVDEPA